MVQICSNIALIWPQCCKTHYPHYPRYPHYHACHICLSHLLGETLRTSGNKREEQSCRYFVSCRKPSQRLCCVNTSIVRALWDSGTQLSHPPALTKHLSMGWLHLPVGMHRCPPACTLQASEHRQSTELAAHFLEGLSSTGTFQSWSCCSV